MEILEGNSLKKSLRRDVIRSATEGFSFFFEVKEFDSEAKIADFLGRS